MDLLLINPCMDVESFQVSRKALRIREDIPNQETPHIGVAYILSVARQHGICAAYIDMGVQGISINTVLEWIRKDKPTLVGFTSFTYQAKSADAVAGEIKKIDAQIKTCIGGPHAFAIPQQTLDEFKNIDFVVCGEVEEILPRIFDAIADEKKLAQIPNILTRVTSVSHSVFVTNLDAIPFPAWDMFDLEKYPGTYPHRTKQELPMITGRGCPYRCTFCCRAHGDFVRQRTVQSVISEIENNIEKFGCESIAFMDETFALNRKWSAEFFGQMKKRGLNKKITWACSTRVSNNSPELFQEMREAGCYYIFFGFESASEQTLKRIKKNTTLDQARQTVRWTKQAGIIPVGAFIIGLEGDGEEEVFKAIEFGKELDLYSITFPVAVPFPGSVLRELAEQGCYGLKILTNDWSLYGKQGQSVMESADLSAKRRNELQKLAYQAHAKKDISEYIKSLS